MLCEYSYIPVSGPLEKIEKRMCTKRKDWCPYPVPDWTRCKKEEERCLIQQTLRGRGKAESTMRRGRSSKKK